MKYTMLAAVTALAMGAAVTAHARNERSPNSAARSAYSGAMTDVADKSYSEVGSGGPSPAKAAGAEQVCSPKLTSLNQEWSNPRIVWLSKQGPQKVLGRDGRGLIRSDFNRLYNEIQLANQACRESNKQGVMQHVENADQILDSAS
jgi:hypothetical protein